jgi:sugar/nucleoside kinase (ribokinase family)
MLGWHPRADHSMSKQRVNTRRGLLAGGNWLVDCVKVIDAYPPPEQLAYILRRMTGTGGAPYNVLIDLARCGAPFPLYAAGLVGRDADGREIRENCRRHGIDTRRLRTTPRAPTSSTDVMTELGSGRRTFFHDRGANAFWKGEDLDFERLPARIFHYGYLLLLDELDRPDARFGTKAARLLAAAQAAGMKTSVDTATVPGGRYAEIVWPALPHADYCFCNEIEAGGIAGIRVRTRRACLDRDALRQAAAALMRKGVRELVVIHCPEGALVRTRAGAEWWQSALKVPAGYLAGTAGAGDAFCAGMLFGLHEGWDLRRSLRAATCLAGASLAHPTTTGGVKSLRHALGLARKFGFQPR